MGAWSGRLSDEGETPLVRSAGQFPLSQSWRATAGGVGRIADWVGRWLARTPRPSDPPAPDVAATSDMTFILRSTQVGLLLEACDGAFLRWMELPDRAPRGEPIDKVLHPVIAGVISARVQACLAAGKTLRFEQTLPLASGRKIWAVTLNPLRGADGRMVVVAARASPLASPKRAERRMASKALPSGSIEFTALSDGRLQHLGAEFFSFTGQPADMELQEAFASVHPDDRPRVSPQEDEPDGSFAREVRIRGRDGAYWPFAVSADLFDGPAGRQWYGVATPVTAAVAEPGGVDGAALFKVIDSLNGCCVTLGRGWEVTAATAKAAAWIGLTPAQMIGLDARRDMALPRPLSDAITAAFATGRIARVVFPPLFHPGVWAEYQVLPCPGGANLVFWEVSAEQLASHGRTVDSLESNPLAGVSGLLLVIDRAWRITGVTREAASWVKATPKAMIGRDWRELWSLPEVLTRAVATSFASGDSAKVEFPSLVQDGRRMEVQVQPFREGAYVMFSDVTAASEAAPEETSAEQLLDGISEAVSAEVALIDGAGMIVSINAAWRAASVSTGAGSPGESYIEVCRRVAPGLDQAVLRRGIEDLARGASKRFGQVFAVSERGKTTWRELRLVTVTVGGTRRIIAVHRSLSGVAQVQAELERTAGQLMAAQETERRRIALELHDSTSQHLIALGMGVSRLKRMIGKGEGADDVLRDMSRSLQEAIREIRVLSYLMAPADLKRDGLRASAERFVTGFGARSGLTVEFHGDPGIDLAPEPVQHACYRMIQEALANVYRHAAAVAVTVDLANRSGALVMRIADNGKGIGPLEPEVATSVSLGVGIPGMRARAAQLGGRVEITAAGPGTVVTATLPLGGREGSFGEAS